MRPHSDRFQPGARHGWIDEFCARIERTVWGDRATALLAAPDELPERGAVVTLPIWYWTVPGINVGRKGTTAGGKVLLPVRVSRPLGPIAVVAEARGVVSAWTATGMGVRATGSVRVVTADTAAEGRTPELAATTHASRTTSRRDLIRQLRDIAEDGNRARWEALRSLETYVNQAVSQAHSRVCRELAGSVGRESRPILDRTDMRHLSDVLTIGSPDSPDGTKSPVLRLLDRCGNESTFRRCDPQLYVRRSLSRDAEQLIRRHIGDPRIGPKVRSLRAELDTDDMRTILAAYRARYPGDELGAARVRAALVTPMILPGHPGIDRALAPYLGGVCTSDDFYEQSA